MMFGMGDDTTALTPASTTAATTAAPVVTPLGFSDGLTLWTTPSAALTAVQGVFSNLSGSFASAQLPYTAGLLAPPVALLVLILGMGSKR